MKEKGKEIEKVYSNAKECVCRKCDFWKRRERGTRKRNNGRRKMMKENKKEEEKEIYNLLAIIR